MSGLEVPSGPAGLCTKRGSDPRPHGDNTSSEEMSAEIKASMPTIRLLLNLSFAMACGVVAVWAWGQSNWPVSVLCWLAGGHFLHTFALSLHDAAHGTLHPNQRVNEFLGCFYGTLILVPLTVYRRAHAHHHAQLASIDDPELYPFVVPGTSRAFRLFCAIAEIALGYVYTPLLFLRFAWRDKKLTRPLRLRILWEYGLIASMLALSLMTVWFTGTWQAFMIGVSAPALVAGTYQTLRKYTEHLGLFGPTILQSTRSILPRDVWNKAISSLVQHVDHHGTHHLHARIPYFELPSASEEVFHDEQRDVPVYRSYAAALRAMLLTLPDPKAGPQWQSQLNLATTRPQ